jgi:uncharacterized protein with LGFP repeats
MDERKNEAPGWATLEGIDFWTDRSVSELIAAAGSAPVENPADLQLQGVSEAEWESLYAALGIVQYSVQEENTP